MNNFDESKVMNGSEGELWLDGVKVAECTKFKAEVALEYEDVKINKKFLKGRKLTGGDTDGEIVLYKLTSMMSVKIHEYLKNRKTPYFDIIGKLDDPDAYGVERVGVYNCTFDKLILADWEQGTLGKESYKYKFTEYEFLDTVEV